MFRYMILWIKIPCMFIYTVSTRIVNLEKSINMKTTPFI